jgi:apolipoprotein N-acyltransferase
VPVVRAANTGLSCFINKFGRITDTISDKGEELFVTGFLMREVIPGNEDTLYRKWGDIFVLACLLIWLAITLREFRGRVP